MVYKCTGGVVFFKQKIYIYLYNYEWFRKIYI